MTPGGLHLEPHSVPPSDGVGAARKGLGSQLEAVCSRVTVSSLTRRLPDVCWGVQKPCSSGSSEDPLVSPHTTPALVLFSGSPFLPPEIISGKASQWEPILGAWTRDPFPPALGSASTQPRCLGDSAS